MAHDRRFRFGVQCGEAGSAGEWRDLARTVEDLGYSTLFVPDHFVTHEPLAPMVAASIAAAVTERLRVGMLVLDNDYKHPAVVAKEAATLDLLSDGRLELGLGAGWLRADYEALGIGYDPPGVRVDRLEEALAIVKRAWTGERFGFEGDHYRITDYEATPRPVQRPHPPIVMGAGGPRMLRLAGREADIVGINPNLQAGEVTDELVGDSLEAQIDRKVAWIREGAGERFAEIELQIRYFVAAIVDDARTWAEEMAPLFGVDAEEGLRAGQVLVGSVEQVCETLEERRERWGVSYVVVGPDVFEAFAPVVARLAGT